MKHNLASVLAALLSLPALGAFAFMGGCSSVDATDGSQDEIGEANQALTAEQCDYFDINGTIQICHQLGNGKFKILKLNEQACINAHGTHSADYVTSTDPASPLFDPTCQGNGCLPESAPCDATLPCCEGSTCTNGICVAEATCPCAVLPDWGPAEFTACKKGDSFHIASLTLESGERVYADANASWCGTPSGYFRPTGAAALACVADVLAFDAANHNLCGQCTGVCPASICDMSLGGTPTCEW